MITEIHFHGRNRGDFSSILDVISRANGYRTSWYYYDTRPIQQRGHIRTAQFLVTNYAQRHNFEKFRRPEIIVGRGYGCNTTVRGGDYYAVTAYGEPHKQKLLEKGFDEERIMVVGSPTSVQLNQFKHPAYQRAWLASLGLNPHKKTVLYAPTGDKELYNGLFAAWSEDGEDYQRVYNLCDYIINKLDANLIVRFHDRARYNRDWLHRYRFVFNKFGVHRIHAQKENNQFNYSKFCDVLIGDLSSMNTDFYVQDKPVIHIDSEKFENKDGWDINDRPGVVTRDYDVMLEAVAEALENPEKYSDERKDAISKYIAYVGEDARAQIIKEFDRLTRLQ